MLRHLPRPTIFAHRGASAYAPENTLAAFQLAVRQGADAIELDAKLSSDGHVVVIHDERVDRTTNGKGFVKDLPLAALKEIDAGCSYDTAFCEERIPTLNEVFAIMGRNTFINVDLTNYYTSSDLLPEKVAELVSYHNLTKRVLFSSFHPSTLRRIHKLLPQVPTGFLTLPGFKGSLIYALLKYSVPHQSQHQAVKNITANYIRRKHHQNKLVYAYTVNDPSKINQLHQWGIDGFFTDDPLTACTVIKNFGN